MNCLSKKHIKLFNNCSHLPSSVDNKDFELFQMFLLNNRFLQQVSLNTNFRIDRFIWKESYSDLTKQIRNQFHNRQKYLHELNQDPKQLFVFAKVH